MKKLLAILLLIGSGNLFATDKGAGCPVGGDSCVGGGSVPDNVVIIEAELLAGGKSYQKILSEELAGKRSLLNEQRGDSSKPKPGSGAGAKESKGTLDPKVLKVYKNAGIDLDKAALIEGLVQYEVAQVKGVGASYMPEISSSYASKIRLDKIVYFNVLTKYKDSDLTPEEASEVEELVQKEYKGLSVIQKGLSKIEDVRQQQIDKYQEEKPLKIAAKAAAMAAEAAAVADLDLSDLAVFGPQTKSQVEIQAIFDGSVFAGYEVAAGGGLWEDNFSKFHDFSQEAREISGTLDGSDLASAKRRLVNLYRDKIAAYMDNVAVVDFLYRKLVHKKNPKYGFKRTILVDYSDAVNTSLADKVAKLEEEFGVSKKK